MYFPLTTNTGVTNITIHDEAVAVDWKIVVVKQHQGQQIQKSMQ